MNLPGSMMQTVGEGELVDLGDDDGDVSEQTRRVSLAHEYIREVGVAAVLEALRELGELPESDADFMVYD